MIDGWNKVHGGEPKPEAMSDEEFDQLVEESAEREAARRRKLNGGEERKR